MKRLAWLVIILLFLPFSESYGQDQEVPQSLITSCDCVAFRLDDIQDYYLNQVQMQVIETFEKRNSSLTVGVIGNYIGNDITLVNFLREKIESRNFSLEIANHGWNHEDFSLLSADIQSGLLSDSNDRINEHLGVRPSSFIPPFNRLNEDTLVALAENDLKTITANVTESYPPFVRNFTSGAGITSIYHFPATAKTGDLNADNSEWIGLDHLDTKRDIDLSIAKYGYAVVMMHPQEFSVRDGTSFQNIVDKDQLHELKLLLDLLHGEGYEIATIAEASKYTVVPEFSSYIVAALASGIGIVLTRRRLDSRGWHLPL